MFSEAFQPDPNQLATEFQGSISFPMLKSISDRVVFVANGASKRPHTITRPGRAPSLIARRASLVAYGLTAAMLPSASVLVSRHIRTTTSTNGISGSGVAK